jgi:hypothetical protein
LFGGLSTTTCTMRDRISGLQRGALRILLSCQGQLLILPSCIYYSSREGRLIYG